MFLFDIFQELRDLENDDLNVQLDIFEEHRDDDSAEFQQRFTDIKINFEYPSHFSIKHNQGMNNGQVSAQERSTIPLFCYSLEFCVCFTELVKNRSI